MISLTDFSLNTIASPFRKPFGPSQDKTLADLISQREDGFRNENRPVDIINRFDRSRLASQSDRLEKTLSDFDRLATATTKAVTAAEQMVELSEQAYSKLIQAQAETDDAAQYSLIQDYNTLMQDIQNLTKSADHEGLNFLTSENKYNVSSHNTNIANFDVASSSISVPNLEIALQSGPSTPLPAPLTTEYYDLTLSQNHVDGKAKNGNINSLDEVDWDNGTIHETQYISDVNYIPANKNTPMTPGGLIENFAVRITGVYHFDQTGNWNLNFDIDDGFRVSLDQGAGFQQIIDRNPGDTLTGTTSVAITEGYHKVEVLYYENKGDQRLVTQWERPSGGFASAVDPSVAPVSYASSISSAIGSFDSFSSDLKMKLSQLQTQDAALGGQSDFYTKLAARQESASLSLGALDLNETASEIEAANLRQSLQTENLSLSGLDASGLLSIIQVGRNDDNKSSQTSLFE